jgi:hypothetical protein
MTLPTPQVYGYPFARKQPVAEYLQTFLAKLPGLRATLGREQGSLITHAAVSKEIQCIQDLWAKESVQADNPINVNRPYHEQLTDPAAKCLLEGPHAETFYHTGIKTAQLGTALQNLKKRRTTQDKAACVERAFTSHLCDLQEAEFYDSVKANWTIHHPKKVLRALTCATGLAWGGMTLLRGNSQQVPKYPWIAC